MAAVHIVPQNRETKLSLLQRFTVVARVSDSEPPNKYIVVVVTHQGGLGPSRIILMFALFTPSNKYQFI